MAWYWIVGIVFIASVILAPLLYFVYWELYKRKEWIQDKTYWKSDERFFNYESYWEEDPDGVKKQHTKKVQVAPIRPQVRDVWMAMDNYWVWWFPVINSFAVVYYVCAIIARPFEQSWKWIVRKIANIGV